jgi:dienelactone hydrolase
MTAPTNSRFRDQQVIFKSGIQGSVIDIPSASPGNYYQAISTPQEMPEITVDGQLFIPDSVDGQLPLVIVLPGSLGVAPSHIAHAETLSDCGFATFILDSFGARDVTSTVANQTQYSFAASAYDVLAAWKVLANLPEIDETRIGLQGHSRGGSAGMTAATRCLADAVLGPGLGLRAVLAAYPWCGQQFENPDVGSTIVRCLIGDADEWCSPMQVQGHCHAINLSGGQASLRIVGGAQHSFDRGTAVSLIEDASVAPCAPTTYLADDGAMIHPLTGVADATLMDRDVMVYAVKAGYGVRGARIGSTSGEADLFRDDMIGFWKRALN